MIALVTRHFKQSKVSALVSIAFNTAAFGLTVYLLLKLLALLQSGAYAGPIQLSIPWIDIPSATSTGLFHLEMGILLDPLSLILGVMVSFISTLIMIYSVGYMAEDPGFSLFFSYLSLFVFAMLTLVFSNNFVSTFIAWELVGLCSYLLIGFWFKKPSAAAAAIKAFVVTRTGDIGFLIGIIVLYSVAGTLNFVQLSSIVSSHPLSGWLNWGIPLLIFCGAIGKSAQFPLHVWLPDAMEGPTPVSALIHAATMVAAGVYLVARSYFLFVQSPTALLTVAWIGGFTAFLAATMALVQWDIKRILAYSTISQLGYMMLSLGVGPIGFVAAIFHLLTHAFFKALLFLGAGSVAHSFPHEENPFDMHHYGGLRKAMPLTFITFLLATLAITGCPFFSGFFSKDEILSAVFHSAISTHLVLWGLAFFTALLTSAYMFRLLFLTFYGDKKPAGRIHESPWIMILPLVILALFAFAGGWIGYPPHSWIANFFSAYRFTYHIPETHQPDWLSMDLGTAIFAVGLGVAWIFYGRGMRYSSFAQAPLIKPFYILFSRKWFMDDFWNFVFLTFGVRLAALASWIDTNLVDAVVRGIGMVIGWTGEQLRAIQTGMVQQYMMVIFFSVLILLILMNHGGTSWIMRH